MHRPNLARRSVILTLLVLVSFSLILIYFQDDLRSKDLKDVEANDYLTRPERASDESWSSHRGVTDLIEGDNQESGNLRLRIQDLKRIRLSIRNELKSIENEKQNLLKEKLSLMSKNEKLVGQISRSKAQLRQLELDISSNRRRKFEQTCNSDRISPIVFKPLKSYDLDANFTQRNHYDTIETGLEDENLIDGNNYYRLNYSTCPITDEFKFHLVQEKSNTNQEQAGYRFAPTIIESVLTNHKQFTNVADEACLLVYLKKPGHSLEDLDPAKNNLVIDVQIDSDLNLQANIPAIIASPKFGLGKFRDHLDISLPSPWLPPENFDSIVGSLPALSPIERKYLASYTSADIYSTSSTSSDKHELSKLEMTLQVVHRNSVEDSFQFIYKCNEESISTCIEERSRIIESSLFHILLPTKSELDPITSEILHTSLLVGAIPVIVGKDIVRLPFDEVIDWRRAAITLPIARLPEIHFILRSIGAADIYQLKHNGRRIFENYLATAKQMLDTTISIISLERFNNPPPPVIDFKTHLHNHEHSLMLDTNCTSIFCHEAKYDSNSSSEILGPREIPFPSSRFRRNMSLALTSTYELWNNQILSPFKLYPNLPDDPIPPSEFKFLSPEEPFRPINQGLGGSGAEFSRSLGGDHINEQFTIVILTYERQTILMRTLERLKGLAYLNKIVVVWNDIMHKPSPNLVWPDVGVPIDVVKVNRNSLNNRFLPYDVIETEAIFSMDDDSPLRQDEIVFAFRVWREFRDRIVGFPGRYHAWDGEQNSWMYNSNHSCELSMVLTGGAFYHKYYTYIYSNDMPQVIRSIVDKYMNCEDIAMNFLVAHLTRKPPIKVTSRWTFHCASCTSSLSEDDSHFRERHECLNTFSSVYGYMPLLSTQHRSDSILFKTRLPQNKQKCFKFV